ncbi:MAG: YeeE/YedE family protein [Nitrospirae bacterium]|nr:YeeE/YedE family protein [Nitrospirota bacterium]
MARWAAGKFLIIAGILGLTTGVLVYNALFPILSGLGGEQQFVTLPMLLEMRYGYVALGLGTMLLGMSFFLDRYDPAKKFDQEQKNLPVLKKEWGWLSTSAIAGLAIAISAFRGEYLSFSGGLLALVAHVASFLNHPLQSAPLLSTSTAWRAMLFLGLIPGAFLSSLLAGAVRQESVTPLFQAAFGRRFYLRIVTTFFAGILMVVGALTGGGCTTGAFMSGWPTLSIGSFVMGMTFFGTAMMTAHILYFRKYHLVHEVKGKEHLNLSND